MVQPGLSFILPTLNERENVIGVIRSVLKLYPEILEIIVVDDNSTDGTRSEVARHFSDEIGKGKVRVLHRTADLGLTPSLRDGVREAKGDLVGWMDCDGSMPVEKIGELLKQIDGGADIAVASRFAVGGQQKSIQNLGHDSWLEIFLSNIINRTLHAIFRLPVSDLTSGFIVIRKNLAKQLSFRGQHGEYFIFLLLEAKGLGAKMEEVPYACGTRQFGESKTFGSPRAIILNSWRYAKAFFSALRLSMRVAE